MRRLLPLLLCAACSGGAAPSATATGFVFVPTANSAPTTASRSTPLPVATVREVPPPDASVPLATAIRDRIMAESAATGGLDGDLLRQGRELELSRDLAGARKAYYELITKAPQSPLIPYAYLAFADLFFDEAEHDDPSKLPLARQAYEKVLTYPPPGNLAYAFAWHRIGLVASQMSDDARALDAQRKALATVSQYPSQPLAARLAESARHELVVAYAKAGDPQRAPAFFRSVDATDASAMLIALGKAYVERGMARELIGLYEAALGGSGDPALCAAADDAARALAARADAQTATSVARFQTKRQAVCGP
jgi:tetratricopeptide (TPR) repeat protein